MYPAWSVSEAFQGRFSFEAVATVYCEAEYVDGPDSGDSERYCPQQLRFLVSQKAGYPVPPNTVRTWRNRIGISPDADRCYGRAEVASMLEFLDFRARGYTAQQYVDYRHGRFQPAPF